ncbi:MAG TPA: phage/plasmid primase, P4 family [Stellaceae bacterium]|nr:phage/plasmid primase, P4 family [Stellaceae bacterium]
MREALRKMGYADERIRSMLPEEAHKILSAAASPTIGPTPRTAETVQDIADKLSRYTRTSISNEVRDLFFARKKALGVEPSREERRAINERTDEAQRQHLAEYMHAMTPEARQPIWKRLDDALAFYDALRATAPKKKKPAQNVASGPRLYTEAAVADRFVAANPDKFLYVENRWFVWDGTRYAQTNAGNLVRRMVKEHCVAEGNEIRKLLPAALRLLEKFHGQPAHDHVEKMVRSDARVLVAASDLDRDGWLINTRTGVADLRTGAVMAHDPKFRCSMITDVGVADTFDPEKAPKFMSFLRFITKDDKELQRYFQKWAGYALVGPVEGDEQQFLFLMGLGGSGKTTFANMLAKMLGSGYHEAADPQLFLKSKFERHPTNIHKLRRARFVTVGEVPNRTLDAARLKAFVGGEKTTAYAMRQDPIDFYIRAKFWFTMNGSPGLDGEDEGGAIERRLRIIKFTQRVPKERRDIKFVDRLVQEEGEQILRWAIEGCLLWQKEGLDPPPACVTEACQEYLAEQSDVSQELVNDTIYEAVTSKAGVFASDLITSAQALAHLRSSQLFRGNAPLTATMLTTALNEAGAVNLGEEKKNSKLGIPRLWAVRNTARWRKATPSEIKEHLDSHRNGTLPPRDAEFASGEPPKAAAE